MPKWHKRRTWDLPSNLEERCKCEGEGTRCLTVVLPVMQPMFLDRNFASCDVHCEFCNVRGLERRIKDRSTCCSGWQTFHPEEERLQKHREDAGIS